MKTAQQLFDIMYLHVVRQGKPSMSMQPVALGSNMMELACAYRTPEGLSCAYGCLIPDDVYDPEMEGNNSTGLATRAEALLPDGSRRVWGEKYLNWLNQEINPNDHEFIRRMQRCHDSTADDLQCGDLDETQFVPTFKLKAQKLADLAGLTVPEVVA